MLHRMFNFIYILLFQLKINVNWLGLGLGFMFIIRVSYLFQQFISLQRKVRVFTMLCIVLWLIWLIVSDY